MKNLDLLLGSLTIVLLLIWPLGSLFSIILLFIVQIINLKKELFNSRLLYYFLILIVYLIIKFLFNHNLLNNINYFEKLFLLILVFLSISSIQIDQKKKLIIVFISSLALIQLYSIFHILYFTSVEGLVLNKFTNYHYINEAIGFERPYIGFISAISILFLLFENSINIKKKVKFVLLIFSFGYIIFISAKLAFLLSILYFLVYLIANRKYKFLIGNLFFIVFIFSLFSKSFSIVERFSKITDDERYFLWDNGMNLIENDDEFSIVFGSSYLDFVGIIEELKAINIAKSNEEYKRYYTKRDKNLHNQYFTFYIVGGLLGLVLLCAPFLYLLFTFRKITLPLLCVLSLMIFMFIENIFDRQMGVMICGVFIGIIYSQSKGKINFQSQKKLFKGKINEKN